MKSLFKYLLLFCVFCNFFSNKVLSLLGLGNYDTTILYKFVPYSFFSEAEKEMFLIFLCLIVISLFVKFEYHEFDLKKYQNSYKSDSIFVLFAWFFYFFIVFFVFSKINWTFDTSNRGVAQFELENRQTLLSGIAFNFYLPFLAYLYIVGFFRKKMFFLLFALLIYVIQGVTEGGRGNLVSTILIGLMVVNYIHRLKKNIIIFSIIVGFFALTFSASDRFNVHNSIIENNIVKILQCNSSSEFLGVVKYSIKSGIELSPQIFGMHFVSIFIPSYIYVNIFHLISYTRSTFVYNDLYNSNPNSGMGFMMLADFYWCFKYWGYVLYLIVYFFVIKFFTKYIYSPKPVFVVMALYMVYGFCNQRADFGSFVKPVVYTFVFLSLLEYLRNRAIEPNNWI